MKSGSVVRISVYQKQKLNDLFLGQYTQFSVDKKEGNVNMDYNDINEQLECYTGSDIIKDYGGIPPDSSINYVSNTFLDGLVNYIENHRAFMINRYGIDEDDDIPNTDNVTQQDRYLKAAELIAEMPHSKLLTFDDVLLFGKTDNSLYYLWYDRDVSDCCIDRVSKKTFPDLTLDQYIQIILTHLTENFDHWKHDFNQVEPIFVEFKPRGWVSS